MKGNVNFLTADTVKYGTSTVGDALNASINTLNLLNYPTSTLQNVDLNTIHTTGCYRLNGGVTHSAGGNYGVLVVFGVGDAEVRQVQFLSGSNFVYTRVYGSGTWSDWQFFSMDSLAKLNVIQQDFSNNLSGQPYTIQLPSFQRFCNLKIVLSHSQGFYGRYEERYIRRHQNSTYLTDIAVYSASQQTSYNDFTYNEVSNYGENPTLSITTGSSLVHILSIEMSYF